MSIPAQTDLLARLQRWYLSQCNGDWEHGSGVSVSTLDNPGWIIKVNLEGTGLESRAFAPVVYGVDAPEPNDNWMSCKVEGTTFVAAGGPEKLAEMIAVFLNWADAE